MTNSQRLRQLGFNASLQTRGVLLTAPNGATFQGLVNPLQSNTTLGIVTGESEQSAIHALRSTVDVLSIVPGNTLTQMDGSTVEATHRVMTIEDNPQNIAVIFTCETVRP